MSVVLLLSCILLEFLIFSSVLILLLVAGKMEEILKRKFEFCLIFLILLTFLFRWFSNYESEGKNTK